MTEHTGLFVTAHVSLITAAFATKAIATVDHVTHGRAGLNIVCGWNPDEFSPHGVSLDGEHRYDRGLEWYEVYAKLLDGGPKFDWKGKYFDLKGLVTDPLPVQTAAAADHVGGAIGRRPGFRGTSRRYPFHLDAGLRTDARDGRASA